MVVIYFKEDVMQVLMFLGAIALIIFLYVLVDLINSYSSKVFRYEIFNYGNFIASAIGYLSIYIGQKWYYKALSSGGDMLNGELLILIGVIFIGSVIFSNIKRTNFSFGFFISFFQQALYAPLSILAVIGIALVIAMMSETRPVYRVN
jgi:hypothetical protein